LLISKVTGINGSAFLARPVCLCYNYLEKVFAGAIDHMTTREFQQKKPLSILFTYFEPHRGLFILDLVCATIVALIDLAFPLVTRRSMYDLLPNQQYQTFFLVMAAMMAAFLVRLKSVGFMAYSVAVPTRAITPALSPRMMLPPARTRKE
jgi:ABC-type bacteriocin/lantibiotic exporter with double-glycine peptidase domain